MKESSRFVPTRREETPAVEMLTEPPPASEDTLTRRPGFEVSKSLRFGVMRHVQGRQRRESESGTDWNVFFGNLFPTCARCGGSRCHWLKS